MGFKIPALKKIVPVFIIVLFMIVFVLIKALSRNEVSAQESNLAENQVQLEPNHQVEAIPLVKVQEDLYSNNKEDADIQEQLDRDRLQQKQTKDLKNKLEQTNLELEQEKALAEINKLKKENTGAFNEPASGEQNNLPVVRVNYIGGDQTMKEAILTIDGVSYQVKEKSEPTDDIQILSISDSSVKLHFNSPQDLTKVIEFKPE